MRKFIITSLVFSFLVSLSAQALNMSESVQKLQQYSANDLAISETRTVKEVNSKLQEMLNLIEGTVDAALKEPKSVSPELLRQLARVSALTFQADPSEAASELLLPLYQKNKKAFDKAIKTLPKKERADLQNSIENSVREESEGNG